MTEQEIKLQLAEVAGTWVAAVAVVIGGLFGIYQYLEQRFDVRVRAFTAFLFLVSRGLAAGITIYAPAIILSTGTVVSLSNVVAAS